MKKILIALFVLAISGTATAQTKMSSDSKMSQSMENCVMMKDGKMACTMNGKTMPMTKNMTMKNGTVVMANGTVKTKDGKTMMLKNGQCVMMSGKVETMPMKSGDMKM